MSNNSISNTTGRVEAALHPNAEPTTRLYLIRHGQAKVNVEPIIGGMQGDKGLTDLGIEQTIRLRDRLAQSGEIKADVLISSTLPRAKQTADILQPALSLPIEYADDVQEMNVGIGDGMTIPDYKAKYGWVDFEKEPLRPICPGGESWGMFTLRVAQALERITHTYLGKNIVVICHGGVIDLSFLYFFQTAALVLPPVSFDTHNTSITHWERIWSRQAMRWRLEKYNDTSHLIGTEFGNKIDWATVSPTPAPHEKPGSPVPTEKGTAAAMGNPK